MPGLAPLMNVRLSCKLLEQGYVRERLKSFYGRYGDLIKHYEGPFSQMLLRFWDIEHTVTSSIH